jgi:glycosyltransferase involved in cell wall biosynthesis
MEYRPYYLAREWVRSGHRVSIIAAEYSHVRSVQPSVPPGHGRGPWVETIDGIRYRWYRTSRYASNGLGRVWNIAQFLTRVALDAGNIARDLRPDIVVASSTYPMDIWVAKALAKKSSARLVFEVHDLWPLSPIELGGMSPRHPFIRICAAAEETAYKCSDVVISMLPNVALYMQSRGLDLKRLHVVPNGISPEEWGRSVVEFDERIQQCLQERRAVGHAVVGYCGSHGVPNALGTLLDAAAILRDEPISFVLVGDGMEKARLASRIVQEGLVNVKLFAAIPKAQIPAVLAAIDIAYIGWKRLPIYRFGIAPNKLLDYMMAGCVVLHSVEAGNDPVLEAGCGLTVAPESAAEVANGLRQLLELSEQTRREMGARGRDFVEKHHTYPILAARFTAACSGTNESEAKK